MTTALSADCSPSDTPLHGLIRRAVANAIDIGCPPAYAVGGIQSVRLDDRNERLADVVVVEASAASRSPVLHADVLLAVEVVTPGSLVRDRGEKLEAYARSGVPSCWVVDPDHARITFTQFLLGEGGVYHQHVHTDELVTVDLPWEITLDLPAWTLRRDGYRRYADARGDS
jgi:Uma2 family endonuclease